MNATATIEAADLTEGQLYDEANQLLHTQFQNHHLPEQQMARLAELEAEFAKRHAAALAL